MFGAATTCKAFIGIIVVVGLGVVVGEGVIVEVGVGDCFSDKDLTKAATESPEPEVGVGNRQHPLFQVQVPLELVVKAQTCSLNDTAVPVDMSNGLAVFVSVQ